MYLSSSGLDEYTQAVREFLVMKRKPRMISRSKMITTTDMMIMISDDEDAWRETGRASRSVHEYMIEKRVCMV